MFIQRTQEYHQQQTEEVDFDISYQLQRLADGFTLVADMKLCLGQQPLGAEVRSKKHRCDCYAKDIVFQNMRKI